MWSWSLLVACSSAPTPAVPVPPLPTTSPSVPTSDGSVTDVFVQAPPPTLDVLFVVDGSASMAEPQERLASGGASLLNQLLGAEVDWHVGVVSADLDERGALREVDGQRWVQSDTPEPWSVLGEMVSVGTSGSETEQGLGAAQLALDDPDGSNAGFLRDGGVLHVVVLSDEDDQTVRTTPEMFAAWFRSLRDEAPALSAIVSTAGPDEGVGYRLVAEQTGGSVIDIASPSYASALEDLGADLVVEREFFLSELPAEGTLTMEVSSEETSATLRFEEGEHFVYDASQNSVRLLEFVPDLTSVVTVTYDRRP